MSTQTRKTLFVLLLIVCLFCNFQSALACGPFSTEAIFTFTVHPEFPLERFAGGDIGVVQPTYARSYLYVAYRNLSGSGFNAQEQKALVELWKERLDYTWESKEDDWTKNWFDVRQKVSGVGTPPKIEVYRSREKPNEYETYLNCQGDAFVNAATALDERIKKFGAESAEVKDWVQAQDQVFANCKEGQHIPASANADAPALIRADRAYQIAAANFYAGNFDEAQKSFEAIAADQSSPWRERAAYLVARTLLRKASLGQPESKKENLAGAENQLNKVLKDRSLSSTHHAASRLLNLVRVRLHPEDKLHELVRTLVQKGYDENLKQDLWDYTLLLDDFVGEGQVGTGDNKKLPAGLRDDDLTDWLVTFQSAGAAALDHSLQKWRQTSSVPWLVAALSKVEAGDAKAAALLEAAGKVNPQSAAFASVSFQSIRLLNESGRGGEARQKLDDLLTKYSRNLPHSALNLFLAQRLKLATNLYEFLTYAQRVPAGFSWDEDGREQPEDISQNDDLKAFADGRALFDVDAAMILNQKLPLSVLKNAATSNALPEHLKRDLVQATWLRAVLLDDEETAVELVPALKSLVPAMSAYLDDYLTAKRGDARRFAAIYTWLKFPGLEPNVDSGLGRSLLQLDEQDPFRDNWWCSAALNTESTADANKTETEVKEAAKAFTAQSVTDSPLFLDQSQRAAALKEHGRLAAFGAAPNYLCRQVIAWAQKNPDDPRVPEALHLAVKSTRYGCPDQETGAASKAAYQLLHKRYPASPWAKKTPYWFKD
jgi:hypothetical protein